MAVARADSRSRAGPSSVSQTLTDDASPGSAAIQPDCRALLVSVEEHSIIGGLGSAIAECTSGLALSGAPTPPPLLRLGVRDSFGESGLADELLEKHRLTGALIAQDVRCALG